ncbi:hypothetical protein [Bradyrhizobium sp. DASA03120]
MREPMCAYANDWWGKPIDEALRTCIARHRTVRRIPDYHSSLRSAKL